MIELTSCHNFWFELDNRSSHRFWILKSIYQNYTTSTLYHQIWLPSSGIPPWLLHNMAPSWLEIEPCSFPTSSTILLIGHQKMLMLLSLSTVFQLNPKIWFAKKLPFWGNFWVNHQSNWGFWGVLWTPLVGSRGKAPENF